MLYMSAVTAIRCNPVIHAFAQRLKAAAKPAKVVIVACMHKLLSIMNAMLKSNTPWNRKVAGQPTRLLTHLGLPARAPPRSPARSFDRLPMA